MEHEKTAKEKFLKLKNYEEFDARREEFRGLKPDKEILGHAAKIFPKAWAPKGIAWDVSFSKTREMYERQGKKPPL